jgi:hypothetical protein
LGASNIKKGFILPNLVKKVKLFFFQKFIVLGNSKEIEKKGKKENFLTVEFYKPFYAVVKRYL